MISIYPYQNEGAAWLKSKRTALLADEMGLGKTCQGFIAAAVLGARNIGAICPASLRINWQRELVKFWPSDVALPKICVESYDMVTRGAMDGLKFDVLIVDECHYGKNSTAKRTQAVFGKDGPVHRAGAIWCLSGTPTPNHPGELWPILATLAPETITENGRRMSQTAFEDRYCDIGWGRHGPVFRGGRNIDELRERIRPFVLRRTKKDVLPQLPPMTVNLLPLTDRQAVKAMEKAIPDEERYAALAAMKDDGVEGLQDIAPFIATLRRVTGEAKVSVCLEWIEQFLAQRPDAKLVVFAHHLSVIDNLTSQLGARAVTVTGATHPKFRQAAVDSFQEREAVRVFIGQATAAGVGINLTAADTVLFVEQSWTPATDEQAMMRIHRIGQENHCQAYYACLAASLDETITQVAARKAHDAEILFA